MNNPTRLRENLAAAEIELNSADMQRIAGPNQNTRLVNGHFWVIEGGPWTLQTIWDGP